MTPDEAGTTEPVEYQTPLPVGRNLRFQELPDGVRVTREVVSSFSLWREAVVPAASFAAFVWSGIFLAWSVGHRWPLDPQWVLPVRAVIIVAEVVVIAWLARNTWQNAGVVTDIAVTCSAVYWRKQNLWGTREYIWPIETIKMARYHPGNHSLQIDRVRGAALNAFAYFRRDELIETAIRLNYAFAKIKDSHSIDSPSNND